VPHTSGCWAAMGKEREGERRLAGGPTHEIASISQQNEERGRENGGGSGCDLIKFEIFQNR
jgi:hypothetical protein